MTDPTPILRTSRLELRRFTLEDAAFAYQLVNDPDWIRNIGDRNVRSLEDARGYLGRVMAAYERSGFGMYVVCLAETNEAIGTCGLIRREELEDVDIGFAFLPAHRGQGYALESAAAVMEHASDLGLRRIVAIVSPGNEPSIRLLEKIGMTFERMILMPGDTEEIRLYARSV